MRRILLKHIHPRTIACIAHTEKKNRMLLHIAAVYYFSFLPFNPRRTQKRVA